MKIITTQYGESPNINKAQEAAFHLSCLGVSVLQFRWKKVPFYCSGLVRSMRK